MSTLELGVIGNCAIASLIDRSGRHVWHGLGRLDGDPVFNALLGGNEPHGGFMEAAVAGGKEGRQRYLPNTAILETIVEGTTGTLRIVDFAPRFRRFGYGGLKPRISSGSHHARFVGDAAVLRLTTDASITYILMRYVEADDFGKPSNAFLLCTFWYIDALASVGRRSEALELFNNVLGRRNHVGLLSEDIDPKTGELWGNFPQTYSQVGLILSAMRLSRTWEEGLWHAS